MKTGWGAGFASGILELTLLFVVSYSQAEEAFIYPKGGRDPFLPWVSPDGKFLQGEGGVGSLDDGMLEGIIWDPERGSMAILNGEVIRQGGHIGEFEVIAIRQQELVLQSGDRRVTFRLKVPRVEAPEWGEEP